MWDNSWTKGAEAYRQTRIGIFTRALEKCVRANGLFGCSLLFFGGETVRFDKDTLIVISYTYEAIKNSTELTAGEKEALRLITSNYASRDCGSAFCHTVYLDENCELIDPRTSGANICEDMFELDFYFATPLSLIWDYGGSDKTTAVDFPLDPRAKNKWVTWRAGESMPLVVYDQQKTGKITSAEQLFGQHTFGKNWKDGFEALASLDANGDGKLSGEELKDLSLWFDKNQNGVSESGEVVDIREAGVTELYFTKDGDNVKTADIFVSKGYTRVKGGQTETGAAIDWFSKAYDSKKAAENAIEADKKEARENAEKALSKHLKDNLSGMWFYEVDKDAIPKEGASNTSGILLIREEEGKISGRSMIELMLEKNSRSLKSAIVTFDIAGERIADAMKPELIKGKFKLDNKGNITENTVELSADGKTLYGVSRAEYIDSTTKQKKTAHYTWTASRMWLSR